MTPTAKETLIRKHFHGLADWQWEELKDQFPYSEIPFIMEEYADQKAKEAFEAAMERINDPLNKGFTMLKYGSYEQYKKEAGK